MNERPHARLLNAGGELIAEGPCHVDEAAGTATLEPVREPGVLQKERGVLALQFDTGRTLRVSDKPIIFRLRPPARGYGGVVRRTLYRLRLVDGGPEGTHDITQDATAVGDTGDGTPVPPLPPRLPGAGAPAAR